MRQPIDHKKIKELLDYYLKIKAKFKDGTLDQKMGVLMQSKMQKLGLSARSWQRAKKALG